MNHLASLLRDSPRRALCRLALVLAIAGVPGVTVYAARPAEEACGPLSSSTGPFDYRKQHPILADVEYNHFTPGVETLTRGRTGLPAGMELRYVLAVFPNHHRALVALMGLGQKERSLHPKYFTYSIECHFERALRLARDDTVVRLLYAQFLAQQGRSREAVQMADSSREYARDNGFSHFNIGLIYFELGEHERALEQAWKAHELGFEKTQLRQLLEQAGKWRDPPPK